MIDARLDARTSGSAVEMVERTAFAQGDRVGAGNQTVRSVGTERAVLATELVGVGTRKTIGAGGDATEGKLAQRTGDADGFVSNVCALDDAVRADAARFAGSQASFIVERARWALRADLRPGSIAVGSARAWKTRCVACRTLIVTVRTDWTSGAKFSPRRVRVRARLAVRTCDGCGERILPNSAQLAIVQAVARFVNRERTRRAVYTTSTRRHI
jgi:hypothetical protein